MTLEEILSNITILTNNCSNVNCGIQGFVVLGVITTICSSILLAIRLWSHEAYPIGIPIVGLVSGLAITFSSIVMLTNEEIQIRLTNVDLYVCSNNVTIEDMSQYFELSDVVVVDDQIYANIAPISEYKSDVPMILHNMQII